MKQIDGHKKKQYVEQQVKLNEQINSKGLDGKSIFGDNIKQVQQKVNQNRMLDQQLRKKEEEYSRKKKEKDMQFEQQMKEWNR